MPVTSPEQWAAMQAARAGKGRLGIPRKVAQEMVAATPPATRRRLAKTQARRRQLKRRS